MTAVVLFGNGLSQGFSGELALGRITERVRERIETANLVDSELLDEVAALAAPEGWTTQGAPAQDFEALAGPIDRISQALDLFELLSEAQSPRLTPYREAAAELRRLYVSMVGLILEEIDRFCVENAETDQSWDDINDMAAALGEVAEEVDELSVYTLNYDSLLPSALHQNEIHYYDGFRGLSLNSPLDPWADNPMTLYHLHGSLSWIDRAGLPTSRVTYEESRTTWLPAWVAGDHVPGSPAVVLSDLKSRAVQRYPFEIFYSSFAADLEDATSVALGGYGFGDQPVNQRLADYLVENPNSSIIVLHPAADARVDEWANTLRLLRPEIQEGQLLPVNCHLPDADVVEQILD